MGPKFPISLASIYTSTNFCVNFWPIYKTKYAALGLKAPIVLKCAMDGRVEAEQLVIDCHNYCSAFTQHTDYVLIRQSLTMQHARASGHVSKNWGPIPTEMGARDSKLGPRSVPPPRQFKAVQGECNGGGQA